MKYFIDDPDFKDDIRMRIEEYPVTKWERVFRWLFVGFIIIFITITAYKCDQNQIAYQIKLQKRNIEFQLKLKKETVMKKWYNKKLKQWEYETILEVMK